MSDPARAPQRVTHVKRTFGGRSAVDIHKEHLFATGARCAGCNGPPLLRAIVLAPFQEAVDKQMLPEGVEYGPALLNCVVPIKGVSGQAEPYLRLSVTYSCEQCRSTFERALAKLPSWVIVDIHRGPNKEPIITSG